MSLKQLSLSSEEKTKHWRQTSGLAWSAFSSSINDLLSEGSLLYMRCASSPKATPIRLNCLSLLRCARHIGEHCKHGWADRDAVWSVESGARAQHPPRERTLCGTYLGNGHARGRYTQRHSRGTARAMRPLTASTVADSFFYDACTLYGCESRPGVSRCMIYRAGQKGHKLMATIQSNLNRVITFLTVRFLCKFAAKWLLKIPTFFAYVATLPCETLLLENKWLTINYQIYAKSVSEIFFNRWISGKVTSKNVVDSYTFFIF